MSDAIDLRPAQPIETEGRLFARFTNAASHGMMRRIFGKRYEQIIAEAFQSPGHDMSYETTVFATVDGGIAGMASCYSR